MKHDYEQVLRNYEAFSEETIEKTNDFRSRILARESSDPLESIHKDRLFTEESRPVDFWKDAWLYDSGGDPEGPVEFHFLPLGNPMDLHNIVRLELLHSADPTVRIIASGHPSVPFLQPQGKIRNSSDRRAIVEGDLRPMNRELLRYASTQGIGLAAAVGCSLGAELAATSAVQSEDYDIAIDRVAAFEPPATGMSLAKLGLGFKSSGDHMQRFEDQGGCSVYTEAFNVDKKREFSLGGFVGYGIGLARATNWAAIRSLEKGRFGARMVLALDHGVRNTMIMSGSESEVVDADGLSAIVAALQMADSNVEHRMLRGGRHAMTEDVFLHTAMVLEARHAGYEHDRHTI